MFDSSPDKIVDSIGRKEKKKNTISDGTIVRNITQRNIDYNQI